MISKTSIFVSLFLLLPSTVAAFRAPENPTGLAGLKVPPTVKKASTTAVPTMEQEIKNVITAQTMEPVSKELTSETISRELALRKRWEIGLDNAATDYEDEYWFNPTIHNFGNIGFLGTIHAALAPVSTKVIDILAYDGENIRDRVARRLSKTVLPRTLKSGRNPRILDMCCGVGISTRALQEAFPESEFVVGVDTSSEMINVASFLTNHVLFFKPVLSFIKKRIGSKKLKTKESKGKFPRKAKYMICNAERTKFPSKSFDLVTVMYAFHEAPHSGREKILREAHRVLQPGGTLAVIDISTEYSPSPTMLSGEPYVLEYQKNIHRQMRSLRGFSGISYKSLVQGHVGMWTLRRSN